MQCLQELPLLRALRERRRDMRRLQMMYKITLAILAWLSASLAVADDIKTNNGKEYKNVSVSRVDPDGIMIRFSGGIVKIPFTELSADVQKKYGYNSSAAAAYSEQEFERQAAIAQQMKADEQRRATYI